MKHIRIYLVTAISALLLIGSAVHSSAEEDIIFILKYSLRPVAYVSENRFVETAWNVELCNSSKKDLNFIMHFFFLDKEGNKINETKEKCEILANETKKFTGTVLLKASLAKEIKTTKVTIEEIQ
jgi:hypothetical protein